MSMDQSDTAPTAAPTFHVGYDNGYGYRAAEARAEATAPVEGSALASGAAATAPYRAVALTEADAHGGEPAAPAPVADPSFAQTTAIPVTELAAELAAAHGATDAPAPSAGSTRSPSGRRVARSLVLCALAFLVLAGTLGVLLVTRSSATTFSPAVSSSGARSAHTGGTTIDEHGNVIADSIAVLPQITTTVPQVVPTTSGTIVVPTTPVTAAPVTTAPTTAPPTTTAPTVPPTTAAPTTTSTTAPTTTSTTIPKPKILTFDHPATVSCANPANQVPYIPLSWTTQGAVKVTISIDGPGIYKSYAGAAGNDTVPFSCPGPHTYLITAYSATNQATTQQVVIAKA
jgi:hypothetical protein